MKTMRSKMSLALAAASCAATFAPAAPAWAQHREFEERPHVEARMEHGPIMERRAVEDHLNHYFPVRGEVVPELPRGALAINFHGERYFFHVGVFFRTEGTRFVVLRPPVGIIVPVLPPAYVMLWSATVPYYYANDVYYTAAPGSGYVVTARPLELDDPETIAQAPEGSPPAAGSPANPVIYPRNDQAPELTAADRAGCNEWATTQEKTNVPSAYWRAFAVCMEGRGYTVR